MIYVYDLYDNISKDNNSKFPKSPFLVLVWEWRGIGTDCPVMFQYFNVELRIFLNHFILN